MSGHTGLTRWHDYMMGGSDPAVLSALLAEDAVFHSPVVHTPQAGKAKGTSLSASSKPRSRDSRRSGTERSNNCSRG